MNKHVFKLYIDELGMSHPKSYAVSPYYILLGCVIDERYQTELEQHANHIKFKYWGKTDVIFHSADMARNSKEFSIFAGKDTLKQEFYKDLLDMLRTAPVQITAAIIDKEKAYRSHWAEQTVIKRSADIVLLNFLAFIYSKMPCGGKVVIEASSFDRDTQYLAAFNNLLSPSFKQKYKLFNGVRDHLTSINFVTKQNHDIESQVADLMAYGIRLAQEKIAPTKGTYDSAIVQIANAKLIKMPSTMGVGKRQYFKLIDSAKVVPKTAKPPGQQKKKRG
jgi:hypothetical protein